MKTAIAFILAALVMGCTINPTDPRVKAWMDTACAFYALGVAPDGLTEALDSLKRHGVVFTCNGDTVVSTGAEVVAK